MDPLPPPLMKEDSSDYFSTTTGTFHDYKQNNTVLSNAIHKKAAGHWKVGYVEDVIKKVTWFLVHKNNLEKYTCSIILLQFYLNVAAYIYEKIYSEEKQMLPSLKNQNASSNDLSSFF